MTSGASAPGQGIVRTSSSMPSRSIACNHSAPSAGSSDLSYPSLIRAGSVSDGPAWPSLTPPARTNARLIRHQQADAVIAPAEAAAEVPDQHDLEDRDAGGGQFRQLPGRGLPRALRRESAKVHLVN